MKKVIKWIRRTCSASSSHPANTKPATDISRDGNDYVKGIRIEEGWEISYYEGEIDTIMS